MLGYVAENYQRREPAPERGLDSLAPILLTAPLYLDFG